MPRVPRVEELREDPAAAPSRFHPPHGLRDAVREVVGESTTRR